MNLKKRGGEGWVESSRRGNKKEAHRYVAVSVFSLDPRVLIISMQKFELAARCITHIFIYS